MAAKKKAKIPAVHLLLNKEGIERLKQFPKGSEDILAALNAEQDRINRAHVARNDAQRDNAKLPRRSRKGERPTREIVAKVVNRPEYADWKASELLPHVRAAIEGNEQEKPLTDKYLQQLISDVRKEHKRER